MDYLKIAEEIINIVPTINHSHDGAAVTKISKGECNMLVNLRHMGGSSTAGELAKIMKVSTARIAVIINGLEDKGLVKRENVEGDRRKSQVIIMEAGCELVEKMHREALENTVNFLEFLGEKDTENLLEIVKKTKLYFDRKE